MSPSLPIPEDLQHLIEKRETDNGQSAERRQKQLQADQERRSGEDRRKNQSDDSTGESA